MTSQVIQNETIIEPHFLIGFSVILQKLGYFFSASRQRYTRRVGLHTFLGLRTSHCGEDVFFRKRPEQRHYVFRNMRAIANRVDMKLGGAAVAVRTTLHRSSVALVHFPWLCSCPT